MVGDNKGKGRKGNNGKSRFVALSGAAGSAPAQDAGARKVVGDTNVRG